MTRAATAVVAVLAACGGASGGGAGAGGGSLANRSPEPVRACPAATATFVAHFDQHAQRWLLPLRGDPLDAIDVTVPAYATLDAATAQAARLPPPPATLWMDGGDGSWCKATPAAVYRSLWNDGPVGFEYGVELDTACRAPNLLAKENDVRVAVAAPTPPAGCRVDTAETAVSMRTVEWNQSNNTFVGPADVPPPKGLAAAWSAPRQACTGSCLTLWAVDAITSRGKPAVWSIVQTWVTPDGTDLCQSQADGAYAMAVAEPSGDVARIGATGGSAGEVEQGVDEDPFSVLSDDGGARVVVTTVEGAYTTYEAARPGSGARHVQFGFPNEEDFAGRHQLGPYCGP
jgi:hypothetical protein|nr:hypothetical protein [Kofleriaceae bacterium]